LAYEIEHRKLMIRLITLSTLAVCGHGSKPS